MDVNLTLNCMDPEIKSPMYDVMELVAAIALGTVSLIALHMYKKRPVVVVVVLLLLLRKKGKRVQSSKDERTKSEEHPIKIIKKKTTTKCERTRPPTTTTNYYYSPRTLSPGDASLIFEYAMSAHRTSASQNSANVSFRIFSCPSVALMEDK